MLLSGSWFSLLVQSHNSCDLESLDPHCHRSKTVLICERISPWVHVKSESEIEFHLYISISCNICLETPRVALPQNSMNPCFGC